MDMGADSGLKGILLAILIGSAAAGPLYGAFPVAAVFLKKGVKFMNVLIFIGAWSTTKIPMFIFELSSLGTKFAITRLLIDIPGIKEYGSINKIPKLVKGFPLFVKSTLIICAIIYANGIRGAVKQKVNKFFVSIGNPVK